MKWSELDLGLQRESAYREAMAEEYPFEEVALAVVELRAQNGWTQEELARRVGVQQPVIARVESGRANIQVDLLNRIALAAGRRWRPSFEPIHQEHLILDQPDSRARFSFYGGGEVFWVRGTVGGEASGSILIDEALLSPPPNVIPFRARVSQRDEENPTGDKPAAPTAAVR